MMFKAAFFSCLVWLLLKMKKVWCWRHYSFFFFSGKPEMATINSSPEGLYRNSYNLTWSIKSSSPLEKVRILFRKMVSRYILHILLRRSSKFQCCQFRNYVVTTKSIKSFISCSVILKVTLINLVVVVFDHERSLNNFNVSGLGNLIKTIGSVIDLKHATTS